MPAELFRSVVNRPRSSGRKLGAVPLSIALHVAVLVAAVTIPLIATDVLPVPQLPLIMRVPPMPVVVVPPSPPPPRGALRAVRPAVSMQPPTPLVQPDGIRNEGLARVPPDVANIPPDSFVGSIVGNDVHAIIDPPPLPPPPPKRTDPVRPGGDVKMPTKIHTQPPVYPQIAIVAHVQGQVVIEAIISTSGRVQEARVLTSPSPLLDQPALDAVRQWVFTPTLLNGTAVPLILTVTVEFKLQ